MSEAVIHFVPSQPTKDGRQMWDVLPFQPRYSTDIPQALLQLDGEEALEPRGKMSFYGLPWKRADGSLEVGAPQIPEGTGVTFGSWIERIEKEGIERYIPEDIDLEDTFGY